MAKRKPKEEVSEDFIWEVSATITAGSQEAVEAAVEQIESQLDDAADNIDDATAESFSVRLT